MAHMTADGACITLVNGETITVTLGDRLRLKNGVNVRAHFWTIRGVHGVVEREQPLVRTAPDGFGLLIAAYDVGDGDALAKLEDGK